MTLNRGMTRESWLQECAGLILDEILAPITAIRASLSVKVSVGYAPNTRAGKVGKNTVLGCCMPSALSSEGHNEIFITPDINESLLVLEVLVHELIHAIDDCKNQHHGAFVVIARAAGLIGKITHSYASEALRAQLQEYIDLMGNIPHAALDLSKIKKQPNRNLKVWCLCGFKFNTSRFQILGVLNARENIACCACGDQMQYNL